MNGTKQELLNSARKNVCPQGSLFVKPKNAAGAMVALFTNENNTPCAMFFSGRSKKACVEYFHSSDSREEYVRTWVKNLEDEQKAKDADKEALKNHSVKVGDVFYSPRLTNYYRVTKVSGTTLTFELMGDKYEDCFSKNGEKYCKHLPCEPKGGEFQETYRVRLQTHLESWSTKNRVFHVKIDGCWAKPWANSQETKTHLH